MRFKSTAIAAVAVTGAAFATTAVAAPTHSTQPAVAAAARHFEGRVVSVNRSTRTFRLRDLERGTVRIRVTRNTRFERLAGFSALHRGLTRIEATVRRSNGRWTATLVERSGGGGSHGGGSHGGGSDDRGGRGRGRDD